MKRIGIIGLGKTTKFYKDGFNNSYMLDLVAVCDIKNDPASFLDYKHLRFYSDYKKMIKIEMLDYVLIATEPQNHFKIAKDCLELGINVIVEAPIGLTFDEVHFLIEYARENAVLFDVINHSSNFDEVKYFLERKNDYKDLSDIYITINRPFCKSKHVKEPYMNLNGCYYYDAYLAFELLSNFLPMKKVMLIDKKKPKKDTLTKQDIIYEFICYIDGVNVNFVFDWTGNSNLVNTKLVYKKHIVNLCHSTQTITIDVANKIECKTTKDRYVDNYYKYLKDYNGKTNYDLVEHLHEILIKMHDL